MADLSLNFNALFLDLSGVLYDGAEPIAGAVDAVKRARDTGLMLRFVTNTATEGAHAILCKLAGMGIQAEEAELFTAPIAARHYIEEQALRPYCLIHPAIVDDFADLDQHEPSCVLLGDAREGLHYHALNHAFRLIMEGAPLIAIGKNRYFKEPDGLSLDAGAFVHALEWAAGTEAIIMGKPAPAFFGQILASTPYAAHECLMVGDDLAGDVIGAVGAGLQACLVRSGKYRPGDEALLPQGAFAIDRLADLMP